MNCHDSKRPAFLLLLLLHFVLCSSFRRPHWNNCGCRYLTVNRMCVWPNVTHSSTICLLNINWIGSTGAAPKMPIHSERFVKTLRIENVFVVTFQRTENKRQLITRSFAHCEFKVIWNTVFSTWNSQFPNANGRKVVYMTNERSCFEWIFFHLNFWLAR